MSSKRATRWLSLDEVETLLGFSPRWWRERLPEFSAVLRMPNGEPRISEPALAEWCDARRWERAPGAAPLRVVGRYFSIMELALLLDLSKRTVERHIVAGDFGPRSEVLRLGNELRVSAAGVAHFVGRFSAAQEVAR